MATVFSYYGLRDSPIHRLDPRTKVIWLAVGLAMLFTTDDWRRLLALVVLQLALAALARLELATFLPLLRMLVLFGLVLGAFQVLFRADGPVVAQIGPLAVHAGALAVARTVWLRLVGLVLVSTQFLMWTHPTDIVLMLVRLGLPFRYAFLASLSLRFFPILQQEVTRIQEAQQVRGQPLDRPWQRVAGIPGLVLPFCLRVLRRAGEIAVAVELRGLGYRPRRTFQRELRWRPADWLAVLAAVCVLVFWFAGQQG